MSEETLGPAINNLELRIANRHIVLPEETIRTFCKKWKIHSFSFYGSIMRDDFRPDRELIREIAWEVVPAIIPVLSAIIPPENEI